MGVNTLVLNNTNVVGQNNSTFQYNFISGNFNVKEDSEICVSSITLPYSWFNISAALNNNKFSIGWVVGSTQQQTSLTIPDGFYTTDDINNFLQQQMIANGVYLIDSNGKNVYYLQLLTNQTYYANQILATMMPTSLPSGYTQPSNFAGYPTVTRTMYISFPSKISTVLGFSNAIAYGSSTTTSKSYLSSSTPKATDVNSIVVRCSLVDNGIAFPTDILDTFPIENVSFGSNINYNPSFEKWVKLRKGTYSSFSVTFTDENFNTLLARDANTTISLLIRTK